MSHLLPARRVAGRRLLLSLTVALTALAVLPGCTIVVGESPYDYHYVSLNGTDARRLRLGVELVSTGRALASQLGIDEQNSCVISAVVTGSPADHAGLRPCDVITQVDGQPAASVAGIRRAVRSKATAEAQSLCLDVVRGGRPLTVTVRFDHAADQN